MSGPRSSKREENRLIQVRFHSHLDGSGEDGEDTRLLSRRQGWALLLLLHAHIVCNAEKWASAIHMFLMALIPTSEVSGKLSTGLGKTGGGPLSCAVVREMLAPCLDPAHKPRSVRANGKRNAQGGP